MTRFVNRFAFALVLLLATSSTIASVVAQTGLRQRGFIWQVERAGKVGWLVGSLHMLTADAYPLPASMTSAFDQATTLMEEADPDELESPAFAQAVLLRALYMDGDTLDAHLSADTFGLIVKRATAAGLPIEAVRRMKPWMAATTLQALELQQGGFNPSLGLDVHFHQLAKDAKKTFTPLETGLEQVGFLEGLGPEFEDALVRENLQGAESEVQQVRAIANAWRAGDAKALETLLLKDLQDSPRLYQSLVVGRNRNWMPKLRNCFDANGCFVVVGAGHLVGPEGLLESLRAAGYRVTQQ